MIVDGVQRVKRGLIINAVVGVHPYTGRVPSIMEAVSRLSHRLIRWQADHQLAAKGVKVPIIVHRGKEADAFAAKVSANEFRQGDPIIEKARKAQQLNNHGHEPRTSQPCSRSRRHREALVAMDTEKEGPKKKRSKSTRPTPARIQKTLTVPGREWTAREKVLVAWLTGGANDGELFDALPFLKPDEERHDGRPATQAEHDHLINTALDSLVLASIA